MLLIYLILIIFIFLNCWLIIFIPAVITQIFIVGAELAALKEKLIKDAKVEIENHQTTGEGKTSKSLIAQKCTINKKLSVLSTKFLTY